MDSKWQILKICKHYGLTYYKKYTTFPIQRLLSTALLEVIAIVKICGPLFTASLCSRVVQVLLRNCQHSQKERSNHRLFIVLSLSKLKDPITYRWSDGGIIKCLLIESLQGHGSVIIVVGRYQNLIGTGTTRQSVLDNFKFWYRYHHMTYLY